MFQLAEPLEQLRRELICPICRGPLANPYITECDHTFCRDCVHRLLLQFDRLHTDDAGLHYAPCPLCSARIYKKILPKNDARAERLDSTKRLLHIDNPLRLPFISTRTAHFPVELPRPRRKEAAPPIPVFRETSDPHEFPLVWGSPEL
uniref:RING-type domain-containing protein n=1 Tax=Steinernema glaseri TaxID=37863 RepID=A0A1I7YMZ3_9BILA